MRLVVNMKYDGVNISGIGARKRREALIDVQLIKAQQITGHEQNHLGIIRPPPDATASAERGQQSAVGRHRRT